MNNVSAYDLALTVARDRFPKNNDLLMDCPNVHAIVDRMESTYNKTFNSDTVYGCELVQQVGGEDQGSLYYHVFKITTPDGNILYVKIQGWHDSWNGTVYDGQNSFSYVTPKEKTIIVYE